MTVSQLLSRNVENKGMMTWWHDDTMTWWQEAWQKINWLYGIFRYQIDMLVDKTFTVRLFGYQRSFNHPSMTINKRKMLIGTSPKMWKITAKFQEHLWLLDSCDLTHIGSLPAHSVACTMTLQTIEDNLIN